MNYDTLIYLWASGLTVGIGGAILLAMMSRAKYSSINMLEAYVLKHASMACFAVVSIAGGLGLLPDWLALLMVTALYFFNIRLSNHKWKFGQAEDSKRPDASKPDPASTAHLARQRVE